MHHINASHPLPTQRIKITTRHFLFKLGYLDQSRNLLDWYVGTYEWYTITRWLFVTSCYKLQVTSATHYALLSCPILITSYMPVEPEFQVNTKDRR